MLGLLFISSFFSIYGCGLYIIMYYSSITIFCFT